MTENEVAKIIVDSAYHVHLGLTQRRKGAKVKNNKKNYD